MPRRAPKKPDPLIDLSGHLRISSRLARPLVLRTLFERQAPVELEVGCGKGLFLSNMAGRAPNIDFLGVEISAAYARLVASKLARANLSNARIIQGDGLDVLRSCLLNQSLNAVHVYFPDPWWKARHRKRRVLTPIFLAHCARVLVAGGLLHIWTDVEEYFRESLDFVEQTGLFEPPVEERELLSTHDLDYRTHFERRTRQAGEPVWRAVLRRNVFPTGLERVVFGPSVDVTELDLDSTILKTSLE